MSIITLQFTMLLHPQTRCPLAISVASGEPPPSLLCNQHPEKNLYQTKKNKNQNKRLKRKLCLFTIQ